jgi:peptide/nickel transport system permease protein
MTAHDGRPPVGTTAGPARATILSYVRMSPSSRSRLVVQRFLRRRSAVLGLVALAALFALAFLGPLVSPWDYRDRDFTAFRTAPSTAHWLGTNQIGADLYAQVLRGMQKSLIIGLLAAVVATGLAAVVGATAGYYAGWIDRLLMGGVDLVLVLPSFLILVLVSPLLRNRGWLVFALLLALFQWMITARIVRNKTRSLRNREYVQAARFMGVKPYWPRFVRGL